ncbi:MAG: ABC transporter permease subunit [Oligosphaeraceae bacterium]|nr:ABC transporter permease subunit [Oligosphaeraceae bacterium]
MRRAWFSLCLLTFIYACSLIAELLCNSKPLLLYFQGKLYFPTAKFYAEKEFIPGGRETAPDYGKLCQNENFRQQARILWAPIKNDPLRSIQPAELEPYLRLNCRLEPKLKIAGLSINRELELTRALGLEHFAADESNWRGKKLDDYWHLPTSLLENIEARFQAKDELPRLELNLKGKGQIAGARLVLLPSKPGTQERRSLRLTLHEQQKSKHAGINWSFEIDKSLPRNQRREFQALPEELQKHILALVEEGFKSKEPSSETLPLNNAEFNLQISPEQVRFPFRPVPGHRLGLDDAGRDVFARILYGLRSSLSFGLILVFCAMTLGTVAGMIQGYLGGWVDVTGQRLTEIWSALPFLYVMILMGSIYGTGFGLLIFCYAIFNWIGISRYMRAEMLRLRSLPFVEAAKCLGLPGWKIACRHILPNSLVPLITFFPFSLVGAIASLAALDYLGFGLPPPTPSLGQLLQQAQSQRWAWWLTLYPSLALFTIMLLGVFIGEGLRNAFDPRRQSRLQ